MLQLWKALIESVGNGYVEFNGEVISVNDLAAKTILSSVEIMVMAKSGNSSLRLLSMDEAVGRTYKTRLIGWSNIEDAF